MNVESLINAIVRQTMVLIAQLATHGTRAPLAHVADQVFMNLIDELRNRGLSHRAVAHMFSLPLSTYHDRIRRFSQSQTKQGSLWQEVLNFIQSNEPVTQARILYEFHRDSAEDIKGILNDLMKARLVSKTGQGFDTTYEITSERSRMAGSVDPVDAAANLLWVAIYGQSPINLEELERLVPMDLSLMEQALEQLVEDARIMQEEQDGETVWTCDHCVIPFGSPVGWEAAVFDHYQALVKAVVAKLERSGRRSKQQDVIGGSTYKFYLSADHPMRNEVLTTLERIREQAGDLRHRVSQHNHEHGLLAEHMDEVIFYAGQTILPRDPRAGEEES